MECMDVSSEHCNVLMVSPAALRQPFAPSPVVPTSAGHLLHAPGRHFAPLFAAQRHFRPDLMLRKRRLDVDTGDDVAMSASDCGSISKHQKLDQQPTVFDRRNLRIKFGKMRKTFQGRQICKEPWGSLVQLAERCVTDTDATLERGSLIWCRNWDGHQLDESSSLAVVEALYTC